MGQRDVTAQAKAGVKRLARPVMTRFYARIDARVAPVAAEVSQLEARTAPLPAEIETRVAPLSADVEALTRYLPTLINTIATQNATGRDHERRTRLAEERLSTLTGLVEQLQEGVHKLTEGLQYVERRGEFIRRELLFEQRYGGSASPVAGGAVEPKVLNTDKLAAMNGHIRLNMGAGHIPIDGYLNVDSREMPGIDVTADVHRLPFEAGQVAEIYSSHLLEHFPIEELRRVVLPYWVSLLQDGGRLVAVVPDTETMVTETASGRMPFGEFREVMYGGQEYEGDFHFNGFSQQSLVSLLEEAGLSDVLVTETARRNGVCYEMEVEAVRRVEPSD